MTTGQSMTAMKNVISSLLLSSNVNPQWSDINLAEQMIHWPTPKLDIFYHQVLREANKLFAPKNGLNENSKDIRTFATHYMATGTQPQLRDTQCSPVLKKVSHGRLYPFMVETSPELGRHIVTTRDIKAGEVLLMEAPLAMGPVTKHPLKDQIPTCVHCHAEAITYLCPDCGFYLCRGDCQVKHRSGFECGYLGKLNLASEQHHIRHLEERNYWDSIHRLPDEEERNRARQTISEAYLRFIRDQRVKIMKFYPAIPTFKLLCRMLRSKRLCAIILSLQSCVEPGTYRYRTNQKVIVDTINKLGLPCTERLVHLVASVWDVNAFQVKLGQVEIQSIYSLGSMFAHSCKPNCEHTFTRSGVIILRAVEDIAANSTLTLCYTDPMWPTCIRRDSLKVSKQFLCQCERCLNPTEYDTYFGHVRCDRCHSLTISAGPTQQVSGGDLKCERCEAEYKAAEFFTKDASACAIIGSRGKIKSMEDYKDIINNLSKTFQNRYHANYYLLVRLRVSLLFNSTCTNLTAQDLPYDQLKCMEELSYSTYKCCCAILPRLSQARARLAREYIMYKREDFRRRGKDLQKDGGLEAMVEETKLVLSWEPRLQQLD